MRNLVLPINITLLILTVAGYLLFLWPGVICHLFLGTFQLSCMLGYLITRKNNTRLVNLQLYIYAGLTLALILGVVISGDADLFRLMVGSSVPLAIYFSLIIYQIEKKPNHAQK